MKEGMTVSELLTEVERQSASKRDYIRRTKDLQFVVKPFSPILEEAERIISGGLGTSNTALATRPTTIGHLALGESAVEQFGLVIPNVAGTEDGPLVVGVNSLAHQQLATHLDIPSKYYNRLLGDYPALLGENVQTLLANAPDQERRTIRTVDYPTGIPGHYVQSARAFLSNAYRPLDNHDLMKFLMPLFAPVPTRFKNPYGEVQYLEPITGPDGQYLKVKFSSVNISDDYLHVKITVPVFTQEIRVGTTVRAGILIKNSEVGLSRLGIYPFFEVLQCTNGAYFTKWGGNGVETRHVGGRRGSDDVASANGNGGNYSILSDLARKAKDYAFFMEAAETVRYTLSQTVWSQVLNTIGGSIENKIEGHLDGAVTQIGRKFDLGEEDQGNILRYLIDGGDITQWGLANAVTRYSQDVASYDRATELEKIGGDIITLAPSEWKVIATATRKPNKTNALAVASAIRDAGLG